MITFLLSIAGIPLNAYAFLVLWRYFAIPIGAPSIGFAHAMGLLLFWGFLKPRDRERDFLTEDQKEIRDWHDAIACIAAPLGAMAIAWLIVHISGGVR